MPGRRSGVVSLAEAVTRERRRRRPDASSVGLTQDYESDERLVDRPSRPAPEPMPVDEPARYTATSTLGKGGMGEVRLCTDRRIGREVAMKVELPKHASRDQSHGRFLHEARLQARLEHPAIVPVYDVGLEPDGGAYFTMKRVRGRTLADVLRGLERADPEVLEPFGRRRLLSAFGQVCLAVDYAHACGVVHRDLKPQNIMLGDFGEVYVLDWGLAKVSLADPPEPIAVDHRPETEHGIVLGTPGYMAPEQRAGLPIDARTDIYALGAILWEILTLEHHQEDETEVQVPSALRPRWTQPSGVDPAPPELLRIAERAVSVRPEERYASARELWSEVERYLDGDRDHELRRARADLLARKGQAHAEQALMGDDEHALGERRLALRHLGQALALDPSHDAARRALVRILVEPPQVVPMEVERHLGASRAVADRKAGLWGGLALAYCVLAGPVGCLMGARDLRLLAFWMSTMLAAAVVRLITVYRPSNKLRVVVLLLSTAAFMSLSRILGPLLVVPGILAANTTSYLLLRQPWLRRLAVGIALGCVLVPWVLELLGIIEPSYTWADGALVVRSHLTSLPELPTTALLLVTSMGLVLLPALFVGQTARALDVAERRLALHAWQMRQLVSVEPAGTDERARSGPPS